MKIATFAGHRQVYSEGIDKKIFAVIEEFLKTDTSFLFYSGGMGEFDSKCEAAVRAAQKRHKELDIQLVLVLPYMTNRLNTDREYYETFYDDVCIPLKSQEVHFKAAIPERNRWMIRNADLVLAYVYRDLGGAYESLQYAKKLEKQIIPL